MNEIFTVGHSDHPLDEFRGLLRQHAIDVVVDVRSQPYSQLYPQYNREVLSAVLKIDNIRYEFLGKELGARRTEPMAYAGPQARYDLIQQLPAFQEGLQRLHLLNLKHRIALMCAEKDPLTCHRFILVGHALRERGVLVRNILNDGSLEDASASDRRLLELLRYKHDMFQTDTEQITEAYSRQAERIAYRTTAQESA